jgi:F420-non-reducing hydrogenase small subunit
MGGIPGLANLYGLESILKRVYSETESTDNPSGTRPLPLTTVPGGKLTLPTLDESVKSLDQVVEVDYYIPGCPPPTPLLKAAVEAVLSGNLPPKGSILAPDHALCKECPRVDSKPEDLLIGAFKRPHEIQIEMDKCLLAQGLLCMGVGTRAGCGAVCIKGNMPCTGCMGPVSRVRDHGGATMGAIASLIDSQDEDQIVSILDSVPDPAGTFYRYGIPASMMFRKYKTAANGE